MQTPEVETNLSTLIRSLPAVYTSSATYKDALSARASLTSFAASKVAQLKETAPDGDEWDWKGRVEVDGEDGGDGEEDGDEMDEINRLAAEDEKMGDVVKGVWNVRQAARYARTGKMPQ